MINCVNRITWLVRLDLAFTMQYTMGRGHQQTYQALFQHPIKRLIIRSREVSKPQDLCLELSDRSDIGQAPRHGCNMIIQTTNLAASRFHEIL